MGEPALDSGHVPDLTGKVALITGAAAGIGAATAQRLAALGATVVGGDIAQDPGERLFAALGPPHRFRRLDVSDAAAWSGLVDETVADLSRIDIVDLNAGVMSRPRTGATEDPLKWLTTDGFHQVIDVNVRGVVYGTMATIPHLRVHGGSIVMISSIAGLRPVTGDALYAMSKHAVVGFGRSLAPVLEPLGISVNVLCPASVDTGLAIPAAERPPGAAHAPPSFIAECVVQILASGETGGVWIGAREEEGAFRAQFSEFVVGGTGNWRLAPDQVAGS